MKLSIKFLLYSVALSLACFVATPAAFATTISFTAMGTGVDGPVDATATITTSTNTITVVLTSLITNPTADGQELSGIFFTLVGAGSGASTSTLASASGKLITIAPGGAVSPASGSIDHWGTSISTGTVCLETVGTCAVGGKPNDLIIGNASSYPASNPSIVQHNPQIQGTGTFVLTIQGVNADTGITGAVFEFGTGPESFVGTPGPPPPPIPEPSTLLLFGTGMLTTAGMLYRRIRAN